MAVENITLNLIPTGDKPSIHVAQFDVDRPFTITLKEGKDDFTPTGYDIELQVRKVDNNIVTTVPAQISGNVVTFNTTEQMTACSGTNIAELQLTKDSQTFATLHFYLVVQRDVLAGGLTSQSEIYDLEEQIAAIVPEVIGDEYYTAEEVDEKIAEIPTFDPTNYYNKSETDALLNDKADVSDLPDMTNYYTKSEVDTKITDLYQIKTVSGSVVNITDGADNIPVKSLVSQIVAVESGSGEKSPDNPYTISGFDNGIITRCGKNLMPQSTISGTLSYTYNLPIPLKPNANGYVFSGVATSSDTDANTCIMTFAFTDGTSAYAQFQRNTMYSVAIPNMDTKSLKGIVFYASDNNGHSAGDTFSFNDIQIEVGNTATTYEAYNGNTYTFAFGQTVYGGHFDNKGNLVVTHGVVDLGSLTWRYAPTPKIFNAVLSPIPFSDGDCLSSIYERIPANRLANDLTQNYKMALGWIITNNCINIRNTDYTDVTAFKTAMNGVMLVYKLKTPITLEIESQDIPTLLGENNIFSNCGDLEVQYFTSKSDGIAELIRAFL